MPTYDYECDACGHKFEEFQFMSEENLKKCPKCGKKKLRRLIGTGSAIIFKGSGFYQTDYRSESYKSAAKSETPASDKTDTGGSDKKTDTGGSANKTDTKGATGAESAPAAKTPKNSKKSDK